MADTGTIQEAIRTGYRLQIAWEVTSQSVANNTSSVTARVQLVSTGSSYTINSSATKNGSLTINGTKYSFTFTASLSGNQTKTIYTKSVTVSHNSDGTKTCAFSATAGINVTLSGTYYGNVTASGNGTFDTIARASSISSVTSSVSVNGTNTCTVAIDRKSSSFTHTVVFSFGSYSKSNTGVGTSTSYAIPTSWLNAIPSATSGTAKVTVTTYSGSTKIGSAVSKNFTITVPSTVVPTISAVTIAETVSGINAQFGGFVQGKSKAKVTITAAGALGSTMTAYKTTVDGKSYTGSAPTTGILSTSGSRTVSITVTDSRGRTASTTRTITVIAYAAPKINTFTAIRANGLGAADDNGTMALARIQFSISAVNNKNTKSYTIAYKPKSSDTWTTAASGSVYAYDSNMLLNNNLDINTSYDLRLSVTDFFGTVTANTEVATAFTLMDFNASGKGLAIGKVSEVDNGMEIDLPLSINQYVYMGGIKKSDEEKDIYFQTSEDAANVHNCKLYGASGDSVTSIGCWDTARSHGIWRYLSGTQNLVFDANVKVTRANGGDEFITSGAFSHGNRSGRVRFSNGLLIQWGNTTITPVANTPTAKAVAFDTAYTDAPCVFTTGYTTVPGTSVLGDAVANITTTGFDIYITRTGTTNTGVMWLAIGYKA
ncbi:MAG: hypothetical protein J6V25_08810 [Oscillospiraceae bacterium]|nr:hypothetical protein [Oscillospiraceae bacterium]